MYVACFTVPFKTSQTAGRQDVMCICLVEGASIWGMCGMSMVYCGWLAASYFKHWPVYS